jgi:hypothetical protein
MTNDKARDKFRYLILALATANFLAAFGGGAILGQASDAFRTPRNTVETFLIGSTLGLGLLVCLRSKWSHWLSRSGGWFSFAAGLTSLVAAVVLFFHTSDGNPNDLGGQGVYALLSIRFSLWFVARVLRPDAAAGRQQKIGWVELSYYLGVFSGLLTTVWVNHVLANDRVWAPRITLCVLALDCVLQSIVGCVDLVARRYSPDEPSPAHAGPPDTAPQPYNLGWYARAVTALVALTIGTQAVIFSFMGVIKVFPDGWPNTAVVLAVFYLSVACASTFYSLKKVRLGWPYATQKIARFATIFIGEGEERQSISFPLLSTIGAAFLSLAVGGSLMSGAGDTIKGTYFMLFIAIAAFIYEILALTILDHIGEETKRLNRSGMVALAYGFIGVGVTVTLLILDEYLTLPTGSASLPKTDLQHVNNAHKSLLFLLIGSVIIANLAMAWSADGPKLGARLRRARRRVVSR